MHTRQRPQTQPKACLYLSCVRERIVWPTGSRAVGLEQFMVGIWPPSRDVFLDSQGPTTGCSGLQHIRYAPGACMLSALMKHLSCRNAEVQHRFVEGISRQHVQEKAFIFLWFRFLVFSVIQSNVRSFHVHQQMGLEPVFLNPAWQEKTEGPFQERWL